MDFILEHNDDPVPFPGSQASASSNTDVPMDEDDDYYGDGGFDDHILNEIDLDV